VPFAAMGRARDIPRHGAFLQHRDHGNGRLTTLITSTEGVARGRRDSISRGPRTEVIACSRQRKWAESAIFLQSALSEVEGGEPMWEAIVVDLQSRKSKPERVELRTLQLINEIRPKLLKQGLLVIGVWTNLQMA
jgi:hypothetical protein